MGISLSYISTAPVPPEVREAVLYSAREAQAERTWWCEPIHFFDSLTQDGKLYGSTKLFLIGFGGAGGEYLQVEPEDDCFMAWRDASFILNRLAEWSRRHSIAWEIAMEGPLGIIDQGVIPPIALQNLSQLLEVFGLSPDSPDLESRAEELSQRYAARND